jgi:hypothetical protein
VSTAINSAPAPDGNGEPETGDRLPEELMAKADTEPEPELLTKAKLDVVPDDIIILEFPIPQPFSKKKVARNARTKNRMAN